METTMNIKHYLETLDQNTEKVLALITQYTDEAASIASEGHWSVLEILEHVYLVEKSVYKLIAQPSENSAEGQEILGKRRLEKMLVTRRDIKVKAPDYVKPQGQFNNLESLQTALLSLRNQLKQDLNEGRIQIDNRTFKHPRIGDMTVMDWLNFLIFHGERHLYQIEEL